MSIITGASAYGVDVTSSNTPNTKGAWSEVISAAELTEDICLLKINILNADNGGNNYLIDVGVGGAGSETVIISNISFANANNFNVNQWSILVPVSIQTGTRIALRCQDDQSPVAGEVLTIQVHAIGGQLNSASVATYGVSTTTSQATTVDPGAIADTKGAWAQLTASSTTDAAWVIVVLTTLGNTTIDAAARWCVDIGTGGAGSESVIIPDLTFSTDTLADDLMCPQFYFPLAIPAGTRIAARAQCTGTDATDRLLGVSVITSTVVAGNFGTFVTEAEPHWDPEYHYMRPAPARHHQTGGTTWNPFNSPSLPEYQIAPQAHQTELPVRRHPRDPKPEGTTFWNPTPNVPGNVTQAGVHLVQQPHITGVTQIGLHIIYVQGPGLPIPPVIPQACPNDDFPIASSSDRACSE